MTQLKKGTKVRVQYCVDITLTDDWDLDIFKSWVGNKCWEALVESSPDECEISPDGTVEIIR